MTVTIYGNRFLKLAQEIALASDTDPGERAVGDGAVQEANGSDDLVSIRWQLPKQGFSVSLKLVVGERHISEENQYGGAV